MVMGSILVYFNMNRIRVFMFLGTISVFHQLHLALRLKKLLFWCYNCNVQNTFSSVCLGYCVCRFLVQFQDPWSAFMANSHSLP